jgi:hypothetical protein
MFEFIVVLLLVIIVLSTPLGVDLTRLGVRAIIGAAGLVLVVALIALAIS